MVMAVNAFGFFGLFVLLLCEFTLELMHYKHIVIFYGYDFKNNGYKTKGGKTVQTPSRSWNSTRYAWIVSLGSTPG